MPDDSTNRPEPLGDDELVEKITLLLRDQTDVHGYPYDWVYNDVAKELGIPNEWRRVSKVLQRLVASPDSGVVAYRVNWRRGGELVTVEDRNPDQKRQSYKRIEVFKWSPERKQLDMNPHNEVIERKVVSRLVGDFLRARGAATSRTIRGHVIAVLGHYSWERLDAILKYGVENGFLHQSPAVRTDTLGSETGTPRQGQAKWVYSVMRK